jgi:hypothetical protein
VRLGGKLRAAQLVVFLCRPKIENKNIQAVNKAIPEPFPEIEILKLFPIKSFIATLVVF